MPLLPNNRYTVAVPKLLDLPSEGSSKTDIYPGKISKVQLPAILSAAEMKLVQWCEVLMQGNATHSRGLH